MKKNKNNKKSINKSNKRIKFLITIILVITIILMFIFFYNTSFQFKRYLIKTTNKITQRCNLIGTFKCKDFKIFSNGTLELYLYNPSFDILEGHLKLFDENNRTYNCSLIKNWEKNSTIKIVCNFSKGKLGKKEKISFKLIYSPKDNPIYITETGVLLSRRE